MRGSVPDGESLSEIRVDHLVAESMERLLGEHREKMQQQSEQLSRELHEVFQQAATQNAQAAAHALEETILSRLADLATHKTENETALQESMHRIEERIVKAVGEMPATDITATLADTATRAEQAANKRAQEIV